MRDASGVEELLGFQPVKTGSQIARRGLIGVGKQRLQGARGRVVHDEKWVPCASSERTLHCLLCSVLEATHVVKVSCHGTRACQHEATPSNAFTRHLSTKARVRDFV